MVHVLYKDAQMSILCTASSQERNKVKVSLFSDCVSHAFDTVNVVIFAGGKFHEHVGKIFHVGVIFTILLLFPS